METSDASGYHHPDDRSDSGVSSLRSSASGDERSGSRSSALSSTDDTQLVANRSPYNRSPQEYSSVRSPRFYQVWRDPNLSEQAEPQIRHVNSVQHQSLLMSHQSTPSAAGGPPTTSSVPSASLYAPPSLISPHPRPLHSHLGPNMYAPGHHIPEMLWKSPYNLQGGIPSSHLLAAQQAGHHADELMERERIMQERHNERVASSIRERQIEAREIEKLKEREKERAEREKQEKMEREREEKERQEQALQNHFEKSLRAAQQKREQWNPITGRPSQPQRSSSAEEDKKRAEQEMRDQRLMASRPDPKDNRFYANVQQRVPSMTSKVDYPPPAHSSRVGTMKQQEKMTNLHSVNQKNEMAMFGYSPYHPQGGFSYSHDTKSKDLHKTSSNVGLLAKSASPIERELPNPPPLISEMKNSVIVKHDGKNPHHMEPRVSIAHSPSPKLRTEMMGHYMPLPQTSKGGSMYEYRSPTQSPHHLAHTSPHHLEAQSMGKTTHHRQISSPHHQRQSPHQHSSPEMRYRGSSEGQTIIYPAPGKTNYQFLATTAGYSHHTTNVSNSKPKVSSPAPHHIYGKPSAGILSGLPPSSRVEQTPASMQMMNSKPPLPLSISPSPFQQASQYHPPPPQVSTQLHCPPPAHRTVPYDRIYPGTTIPSGIPSKPTIHGTSPPTASAAPSGIPRSHPQYLPQVSMPSGLPVSPSMQMQPLDLGMSSSSKHETSSAPSPKRKGTPVHMVDRCDSPVEAKKRKLLEAPSVSSPQVMYSVVGGQQPQLTRVNEPTPLIASEATTITTLVNSSFEATTTSSPSPVTLVGSNPVALAENLPDLSVTPVEVSARPGSAESGGLTSLSFANSDSPAPGAVSNPSTSTSGKESPTTSIKTTITPNSIDSEKSNSPGPNKSSSGSYPVRHLKKAWLQRHTGEDMEDTTGVVGSGSCVTLPINISTSATNTNNNKDTNNPPVNTSLHTIGSMAVNSISKTKHLTNKSNNRKAVAKDGALNGHPSDLTKGDDSSSSDQERGRKSPPKRKPPKVKRKKGGGAHKKPVEEKKRKTSTPTVASESGSDSDKDTASEKDSDSGASTTISVKKGGSSKEPRKRGRRPKISKNSKTEEPRAKKPKEEAPQPQRDPFRKPPVGQLKKTGESFLQDGPCFEVAPKLAKCRECRWTPNQRSKNMPNIFCRFYAFRRLRYTKNGQLAIAGFSDPHKNSLEDDIKLWLPNPENPPSDLDLETSKFLLKQVGDHFCDLLVQEKNAVNEHLSDDKTVAWKRVVQGVREMCDVCETTLFNFHWACGKCGFVVCLDCYKGRKNGTLKIWGETGKDRDEYSWLLCTNRQAHEQEKLMLTQIIADNCLMRLGKMVHEVRELWNIEQFCDCPMSKEVKSNNLRSKDIIKNIMSETMNGSSKKSDDENDVKPTVKTEENLEDNEDNNSSPLSWFGDMLRTREKEEQERVVKKEKQEDGKDKNEDVSSEDDDNNYSTLRELLIRPSHKQNGSRAGSPTVQSKGKKTNVKLDNLDEVLTSVIEENSLKADEVVVVEEEKCELKHFVRRRRYNWQVKGRVSLPIRIMTMTESKILYPNVPHSWLCDGKLLRLIDPTHKENYKIFQDQWKRGQPVIVSDVNRLLNKDLWNPDAFARDFGEDKNDLINCMTGNLVPNQPMKKFWEGFDHFEKRLKDDRGNPMLLKLKDWPPGEDFAEMLPTRFQDLMEVLPLGEYTHRNGRLNLASRLPDCFVRPDLGPKMYNAYGSALHPSKGTTNLHLDISDAVNVMVYVGIPKDGDSDEHIKEAFRAIDEAGCDILTRRRVRDKGELPGALWHIYNAKDADKIRDLLNKVVMEKGGRLEPNHDPIHDQSCYLDGPLRERLYKEYGVEGYAIVQCLGDAVFIPAGAPHQVRNLHNCIKVAEDFVSPENVSHCFHLTQEFRDLSDTHSNHEDKLQIKNIIYHAVKDSLSTLNSILNQHVVKFDAENSESNGNSAAEAVKKEVPAETAGSDV